MEENVKVEMSYPTRTEIVDFVESEINTQTITMLMAMKDYRDGVAAKADVHEIMESARAATAANAARLALIGVIEYVSQMQYEDNLEDEMESLEIAEKV